ncbi:hypothetical protein BDV28DRAFT_141294 [Aspergillus coremiiformis]|uniref:Uncharacterized protein n=1 Tax=Aspergillus coremiiformis TaxID=138285 RepID=A0A5N6YW90_9EURO|nr:hypothetical protein BDV28DRAFT_141294 [Aspergillus coremiiformis]
MSTVNLVKYYFHKTMYPQSEERLRKMIALAYQTARDRKIYPKAVFIRSEVHDTTSINGKRQKDPLGDHVTLCYKDEDQLRRGTHVASHGYVKDGSTLEFVQATHHAEKPDSTKKRNREDVWPSEESLAIAPEIGYGHFLEE